MLEPLTSQSLGKHLMYVFVTYPEQKQQCLASTLPLLQQETKKRVKAKNVLYVMKSPKPINEEIQKMENFSSQQGIRPSGVRVAQLKEA